MNILTPCKAIWTFPHRHFASWATVMKYLSAEMSQCRHVHGAIKSLHQKVPYKKSPRRQNIHVPECLQGRIVDKPKCPGDKMFVPKCLWPKCQVQKWWKAEVPNLLKWQRKGRLSGTNDKFLCHSLSQLQLRLIKDRLLCNRFYRPTCDLRKLMRDPFFKSI